MRSAFLSALILSLCACGDPDPERLSHTGIDQAGVRAYAPAHELWSDGATKRRLLWLPEAAAIDTSDPDNWVFPGGTKAWKEFSRDGVVVETRLLEKTGAGSWRGLAFVWDGDDAFSRPGGERDANGTPHDVPDQEACFQCHPDGESALLGVSAIQLAHDQGDTTLASLEAEGLLSDPIAAPVIPGDDITRDALGYLHANCGNCHNDDLNDNPLRLRLLVDRLTTPEDTPTYQTAVGVATEADPIPGIAATVVVEAGSPDDSALYLRMSLRGEGAMPFVGSEDVDPAGTAAIAAWIESL